jgi:hypothetical protein
LAGLGAAFEFDLPAVNSETEKQQGVCIVSALYAAEMTFVATNKCEFQIETVSS